MGSQFSYHEAPSSEKGAVLLETCVFCHRADQPTTLFETESLYVMPDKFPLTRGHILIISKEHLPCYGAASPFVTSEVTSAARRVGHFLRAQFGAEVWMWENGVSGQSIPHAHLHLLPVSSHTLLRDFAGHPDVYEVEGWSSVEKYYRQHGCYRYVEAYDRRLLVRGRSPVLKKMRQWLEDVTVAKRTPSGWVRHTTPADVIAVEHSWMDWNQQA